MKHADLVERMREAGEEGDWGKMKATVGLVLDLFKMQEDHIEALNAHIKKHEDLLDSALGKFTEINEQTLHNS